MKKKNLIIIILIAILLTIISTYIISKHINDAKDIEHIETGDTNEIEEVIEDGISSQKEDEESKIENEQETIEKTEKETGEEAKQQRESNTEKSGTNASKFKDNTTEAKSKENSLSDDNSNASNSITVDTQYAGDIHLSDDDSASAYVMESEEFNWDIDTSDWSY